MIMLSRKAIMHNFLGAAFAAVLVAPTYAAEPTVKLSITEKPTPVKGTLSYIHVKNGGLFFTPEADALYVQRGDGGGSGGPNGMSASSGGPAIPGFPSVPEALGVWNVASKKKLKHIANNQVAILSPDGNKVASVVLVNNRNIVRLTKIKTGQTVWDADAGKALTTAGPANVAGNNFGAGLVPISSFPVEIAFTPDGKRIAIQAGTEFTFADAATGKLAKGIKAPALHMVGVLSDGTSLVGIDSLIGNGFLGNAPAGGPAEGKIVVWDAAKGEVLRRIGEGPITHAVLTADRSKIVTFNRSGGVGVIGGFGGLPAELNNANEAAVLRIWDTDTGNAISTCETGIKPEQADTRLGGVSSVSIAGGIMDAAFTPDGRIVASCLASGAGGTVQLFDVASGKELASIKVDFCSQAIAFSRDGALLATGGGLGNFDLRVWDVGHLTSTGVKP